MMIGRHIQSCSIYMFIICHQSKYRCGRCKHEFRDILCLVISLKILLDIVSVFELFHNWRRNQFWRSHSAALCDPCEEVTMSRWKLMCILNNHPDYYSMETISHHGFEIDPTSRQRKMSGLRWNIQFSPALKEAMSCTNPAESLAGRQGLRIYQKFVLGLTSSEFL